MSSESSESETGQTAVELHETETGQTVTTTPLLNEGCCDTRDCDMTFRAYRVTTQFKQHIIELFEGATYLACQEKSDKGVDHFHVLVVPDNFDSTFRQRKCRKENLKNLKSHSQANKGTLAGAISYIEKDGNFWKTPDFPDIPHESWVHTKQTTLPSDGKDDLKGRDFQLTFSNLVFQAVKWHRKRGLSPDMSLRSTVQDLIRHTKWRPSIQLVNRGVPEHYDRDFQFRLGKRKDPDMEWFNWRG